MAVKAQNLSHEDTRELLVLIIVLFHSGGRVVSCSSCQGQVSAQRVSRTQEVPAGRKQVGVRRRWSPDADAEVGFETAQTTRGKPPCPKPYIKSVAKKKKKGGG